MKNSWDYCLLGLVVCIGLGLAGFNAVWSWADCPNSKGAPAMCTSCQNTYSQCQVRSKMGESGFEYYCEGGGLMVNSDGPFGIGSENGSYTVRRGDTDWCTFDFKCEINFDYDNNGAVIEAGCEPKSTSTGTAEINTTLPCGA